MKSPAVPSLIPVAAAGPLPALRAATRSHHDRVDRLVDLARLRERAHYARVLQALDGFLGPWEDCVLTALPAAWHGWLRQRSRRAFLAQDLRSLGVAPLAAARGMLPLRDSAAAWGSVYVLEGSALGGQVIARSLVHAGFGPGGATAYFHGWGGATGRMWAEVRALLEGELATRERLAHACEAACLTFDALAHQLETVLHERASLA